MQIMVPNASVVQMEPFYVNEAAFHLLIFQFLQIQFDPACCFDLHFIFAFSIDKYRTAYPDAVACPALSVQKALLR
jgi:hypothetical protein